MLCDTSVTVLSDRRRGQPVRDARRRARRVGAQHARARRRRAGIARQDAHRSARRRSAAHRVAGRRRLRQRQRVGRRRASRNSGPSHMEQTVAIAPANAGLFGWWRSASAEAKRALIAAGAGWMLDSFDVMLYALVLASMMTDLGLSKPTAGWLGSIALLAAAFGGVAFGVIADRFGRTTRADGQRPHLLVRHRRLRPRQFRHAARHLPRHPRHRHGRRMGERRRARLRDVAERTPRQSPRPDAERLGDRLRRRRDRHLARPAHRRLARRVLRRRAARAPHAVGAPPRRRTRDLARETAAHPARRARPHERRVRRRTQPASPSR